MLENVRDWRDRDFSTNIGDCAHIFEQIEAWSTVFERRKEEGREEVYILLHRLNFSRL